MKKKRLFTNTICLINQISQVWEFYIITQIYRFCTQFLSEITYYHSFLKSRTSNQITLFVKNKSFFKNVSSLINRIKKVCTLYIITVFHTLDGKFVRDRD